MYIQLYTYIATLIAKIYYNSKNMRALISVYIYIYKYIYTLLITFWKARLDAKSLKILLDLLDLELQITMHSLQLGSKVLVGPWGAKRRKGFRINIEILQDKHKTIPQSVI